MPIICWSHLMRSSSELQFCSIMRGFLGFSFSFEPFQSLAVVNVWNPCSSSSHRFRCAHALVSLCSPSSPLPLSPLFVSLSRHTISFILSVLLSTPSLPHPPPGTPPRYTHTTTTPSNRPSRLTSSTATTSCPAPSAP